MQMITNCNHETNLKFPQNNGDVCFAGQVGQDFQLPP